MAVQKSPVTGLLLRNRLGALKELWIVPCPFFFFFKTLLLLNKIVFAPFTGKVSLKLDFNDGNVWKCSYSVQKALLFFAILIERCQSTVCQLSSSQIWKLKHCQEKLSNWIRNSLLSVWILVCAPFCWKITDKKDKKRSNLYPHRRFFYT